MGKAEPLEAALDQFGSTLEVEQSRMFAGKLGLESLAIEDEASGDKQLVTDLLELLRAVETDMTIFYRKLADVPLDADESDSAMLEPLAGAYYRSEQLDQAQRARTVAWLRRYAARVQREGAPDELRRARMNRANPKYILRNYLAQLAIDKAEAGDPTMIGELLDTLQKPYDEQPERAAFAEKRPDWARNRAGCSMLSCSS